VRSRMVEDAGRLAYCEGRSSTRERVAPGEGKFVPMAGRHGGGDPYLKFESCVRFPVDSSMHTGRGT